MHATAIRRACQLWRKYAILPGKMRHRLPKSVRDYLSEIASKGGKARAKKYNKKTLRRWAALGPKVREERRKK